VLNKRIWYSFIPSILWFLIIVVGSFMPSSNVPKVDVSDKWVHFVFYAIFSFLLYFPLKTYTINRTIVVSKWLLVLIVSTTIGILVEVIQHNFIEGRYGEGLDVLANTLGVITALIVVKTIKH
jgi:VanZ family protein